MGHVEPLGHARSDIDIDVNGLEAGRDQGLNFGTRQRLLLKAGRFWTPARGEDRKHGLVAHGRCRPRGRQRCVPRNLGERCRATDEDRSPSHGSCRRVAEPPCQPSIRLPKHGFGLALEDSGPGRPSGRHTGRLPVGKTLRLVSVGSNAGIASKCRPLPGPRRTRPSRFPRPPRLPCGRRAGIR